MQKEMGAFPESPPRSLKYLDRFRSLSRLCPSLSRSRSFLFRSRSLSRSLCRRSLKTTNLRNRDISRVSCFTKALRRFPWSFLRKVKLYKLRNAFLGEVMRGSKKFLQLRVTLLSINANDRSWTMWTDELSLDLHLTSSLLTFWANVSLGVEKCVRHKCPNPGGVRGTKNEVVWNVLSLFMQQTYKVTLPFRRLGSGTGTRPTASSTPIPWAMPLPIFRWGRFPVPVSIPLSVRWPRSLPFLLGRWCIAVLLVSQLSCHLSWVRGVLIM